MEDPSHTAHQSIPESSHAHPQALIGPERLLLLHQLPPLVELCIEGKDARDRAHVASESGGDAQPTSYEPTDNPTD